MLTLKLKKPITPVDVTLFLLPITLGFVSSSIFRIRSENIKQESTPPFQPPPYVFGITWSVLYILLGLAWVNGHRNESKLYHIPFSLLVILLSIWPPVYKYDRKAALFIILASLAMAFSCFPMNRFANFSLAPLCAWLIFAMILSSFSLNATTRVR